MRLTKNDNTTGGRLSSVEFLSRTVHIKFCYDSQFYKQTHNQEKRELVVYGYFPLVSQYYE